MFVSCLSYDTDVSCAYIRYGDSVSEKEFGEISLDIVSCPDYFISNISNFVKDRIDKLVDIENQYKGSKQPNYKASKEITQCYKELCEKISLINEYTLAELIFIVPIAQSIMEKHFQYGYPLKEIRNPVNYDEESSPAHEKFMNSVKEELREIKEDPFTFFKEIFIPAKISHDESVFRELETIASCITEGRYLFTLNFREMLEAMIIYLRHVLIALEDIIKSKEFLSDYLIKKSKLDTYTYRHPWIAQELHSFRTNYTVPTIKSIVISEIKHIRDKNYSFKSCELCGNLYVAKNTSDRWCNCPNHNYNNKPCNVVGRLLSHKTEYKLYKKYISLKKTYRNWINNQFVTMPSLYEYEHKDAIISQIDVAYEYWSNLANEVMLEYELGKISLEKALTLMKLPKIDERSELLKKYKLEQTNKKTGR